MPATTDGLIVNDRDLADFGFVLERASGLVDGLAYEWETAPSPGRMGELPLGPEARATPRDIVATGHLERVSSVASLATAYRNLIGWVTRGLVEIRSGLDTDKVYHGWYQHATGAPLDPQMLSEWGSLALTFRCHDPLAYDVEERVYRVASTASVIPSGTGPSVGVLRVKGATTSPLTITKRNHAGIVTGELTLGSAAVPFTLGANDRVEINSLTGTIQRFTAGVAADAIAYLDPTSLFPLVIGADEADYAGAGWATLEVSSGLSTGAAEWIGARTWL